MTHFVNSTFWWINPWNQHLWSLHLSKSTLETNILEKPWKTWSQHFVNFTPFEINTWNQHFVKAWKMWKTWKTWNQHFGKCEKQHFDKSTLETNILWILHLSKTTLKINILENHEKCEKNEKLEKPLKPTFCGFYIFWNQHVKPKFWKNWNQDFGKCEKH